MELKLKCTNHFVLCGNGKDNDNTNSNNVIYTIKDKRPESICLCSHIINKGQQSIIKTF